ncbi:MAG TPA: GNAT family N-acetyltransferase, partial [Candidatus Coprenecus pullicola]|nr:GNAT family N-acetyltransferase [Candidatus Coprenecus pullicola]
MFRLSNDDDIPKLRMLWKKCFDADSVFLDLFFGKGYGLTRTYVMETEAGLVSALSIFPIKYAGHNGGYVYGVCTHPEHRGHRHAVSLLSYAEEQLLDKEIDFM